MQDRPITQKNVSKLPNYSYLVNSSVALHELPPVGLFLSHLAKKKICVFRYRIEPEAIATADDDTMFNDNIQNINYINAPPTTTRVDPPSDVKSVMQRRHTERTAICPHCKHNVVATRQ